MARHFRIGSARHKGDVVVFESPKAATFGRHVCQVSKIEGVSTSTVSVVPCFWLPGPLTLLRRVANRTQSNRDSSVEQPWLVDNIQHMNRPATMGCRSSKSTCSQTPASRHGANVYVMNQSRIMSPQFAPEDTFRHHGSTPKAAAAWRIQRNRYLGFRGVYYNSRSRPFPAAAIVPSGP